VRRSTFDKHQHLVISAAIEKEEKNNVTEGGGVCLV